MHSGSRKPNNIYWSWRLFLRANLPNERVIYNPVGQPKPTDIDKWIIFWTGRYSAEMFSESVPRLMCVARADDDDSVLMDLVSDVLATVDRTGTESKFMDFYDKSSATVIGTIDIIRTPIGPTMPYDTGIDSVSIDVFTRVKTDRNM